jgi:surface antigen
MTIRSAPIRRLLLATLTVGLLAGAPGFSHAEMLNCVQFVKKSSSVVLSGDAYKWWEAADGHYNRGNAPKAGAVMVFSKTRRLPHGHVAIVQEQIDNRTLLIDHANWSRIGGHRGHVERNVRVVDVSKYNDWSVVRVWYHSLGNIGDTAYHVSGFVYPKASAGKIRHHSH